MSYRPHSRILLWMLLTYENQLYSIARGDCLCKGGCLGEGSIVTGGGAGGGGEGWQSTIAHWYFSYYPILLPQRGVKRVSGMLKIPFLRNCESRILTAPLA